MSANPPRWALTVLLGVFLLGLGLRLDAVGHLLPYLPEPDNCVATQLWNLEEHVPPSERTHFFTAYPLLLAGTARLWPAEEPPTGDDLRDHLRAASTVTLRLRVLTAALSSLLVLLTWSLARRFMSPIAALMASFFLATSLLHLLFSQQARPHAPHATLALAAVLCAMRLRARPTWGSFALAGIAATAAIACLQSGIAVLIPLVIAHLFREKDPQLRGLRGLRGPRGWTIVPLVLMVLLAALAFYPARSGVEIGGAPSGESTVIRLGMHKIFPSNFNGYGFVQMHRLLVDHEPGLYVLAILGLVLALRAGAHRRLKRDLFVPIAYAIPYALAIGVYADTYERFLLPLLPYLACLAGYAVAQAAGITARLLPQGSSRAAAALCIAVPPLLLQGWIAWRYVSVRDAPDAIEQATQWIRENVDPQHGPILVTPELTMPLFHDPETFENNLTPILASIWVRYQATLPHSATRGPRYRFFSVPWRLYNTPPAECPRVVDAQLAELQPAFAVIEVSARILNRSAISREIYEHVRASGELVFAAEGEPVGMPIQRPLDYQNMPRMLRRLLAASCLGPRVEIWRLRRA